MGKLAALCGLLGLAILAAGLFGAVHNQVSYSVGPEYFTVFKFRQFGISPDLGDRAGAALVGWRASWWMGLVVGLVPLGAGAVLVPGTRRYLRAGVRAIGLVVLSTAVASALGLAFGVLTVDAVTVRQLPVPAGVTDPVGFIRAGVMHDASYLGGLLGIVIALLSIIRARRNRS